MTSHCMLLAVPLLLVSAHETNLASPWKMTNPWSVSVIRIRDSVFKIEMQYAEVAPLALLGSSSLALKQNLLSRIASIAILRIRLRS